MDLQIAKVANIRLLRAARAMAFLSFAVAALLLVVSLQAPHDPKSGTSAKGVDATQFLASRTL